MNVIATDIWLCEDCTVATVNGDFEGIDSESREKAVIRGLRSLPNLVPDDHEDGRDEFSWSPCGCCKSALGGSRTRFAQLGD